METVHNCKCSEIVEKKKKFIYVNEECGNKASFEIKYTLFNNQQAHKTLCKRHYKSVTAWLNRIGCEYSIVEY